MTVKRSSDKRAAVLAAGEGVFLRQGYARTTMGDLAEAAAMSRPALYLVFPRKHEVFAAIIQAEARESGTLAGTGGESAQLQHWMTWVCDLWMGEGAAEADADRPRADASPRDAAFLTEILAAGLARRLPRGADAASCRAVADLVTYCVCGLADARLGAAERRGLLAIQIAALAETALRRPAPIPEPRRARAEAAAAAG